MNRSVKHLQFDTCINIYKSYNYKLFVSSKLTNAFKLLFVIFAFTGIYACSQTPKEVKTEEFRQISKIGLDVLNLKPEKKVDLARQIVTNASVMKQKGRYAEAILQYQEALRWDTTAGIYFAMAESYWALDMAVNAIENSHKAIEIDSLFVPAYELLFNVFSSLKSFREAFIIADQILKIDPSRDNKIRYAVLRGIENPRESIRLLESYLKDSTDTELMMLLSSAYEQNEQYDKMAKILDRLHRDTPSNYEVASGLIDYYSDTGDLENAYRVLSKSEKYFDPKQVVGVYNTIGINLLSSDLPDKDEIIRQYLKSIDERFYFEWVTQSVSGRLSSIINDSNNAEKFYERAFFLNDTNSFLYLDAAIAFSNLKNNQKSLEYLNKGKLKFPDDSRFDFYLSNTYLIMKDFKTAENFGHAAYLADSSNILYTTLYASILQEVEKYDESDRLYEKALELDPLDANTNNNYAYSLSIRGKNLQRAKRLSKLSLESEPENAAYLDTYGWIHFQMGDYTTALEYIEKAIETGDVSAEVFEHLGDIYIKLNKKEFALEAYLKALELDRDSLKILEKVNQLRN